MNLRMLIEELEVLEETYGGDLPVYVSRFKCVEDVKLEGKEDMEIAPEFDDDEPELFTLPQRVRIY